MIRNEKEYQEAVSRLRDEERRLEEQRQQLAGMDLTEEQIKRALDPVRSFYLQLQEEVDTYEQLKRGYINSIMSLSNLGRSLVALRIARNISQSELARRLDVSESQVSRDERNEYHGITVDRAQRVIEALNASLEIRFSLEKRESCWPSGTTEQRIP
ncbi:helix-turn-helix transcriptional regulator [Archangium sp.]|uniref:helix-turn-helix transcriptional regulator n=1 Tax=Archangium sp. TaxID=1872627 RepID=UPI00286AAF65|nr:helix-turn-helix transcriptional regulator [Archangium sp.]